MSKIFLVDNHKEHLDKIENLLNAGYDSFVEDYNKIKNINPISIKDRPCLHKELVSLFDDGNVDRIIPDKNISKDNFYIIDLCLKKNEEDDLDKGDIENLILNNISGYKLAKYISEKINNNNGINNKGVAIFSRFPIGALGISEKDNDFSPVITKPFDTNLKDFERLSGGYMYPMVLPRELLTRNMIKGFCNIVFYKYFCWLNER